MEDLAAAIVVLRPRLLAIVQPASRAWLRACFDDWSPATGLPPALRKWVTLQQVRLDKLEPLEPFSLHTGRRSWCASSV